MGTGAEEDLVLHFGKRLQLREEARGKCAETGRHPDR